MARSVSQLQGLLGQKYTSGYVAPHYSTISPDSGTYDNSTPGSVDFNGNQIPLYANADGSQYTDFGGPADWDQGNGNSQWGGEYATYDPSTGQFGSPSFHPLQRSGSWFDEHPEATVALALSAGAAGAAAGAGDAAAGTASGVEGAGAADAFNAAQTSAAGSGAGAAGSGAGMDDWWDFGNSSDWGVPSSGSSYDSSAAFDQALNGSEGSDWAQGNPSAMTSNTNYPDLVSRYGKDAADRLWKQMTGSNPPGSVNVPGSLATGLLAAAMTPTTINTNQQTSGQEINNSHATGQVDTQGHQGLDSWLRPYAENYLSMAQQNAQQGQGATTAGLQGMQGAAQQYSSNPLNPAANNQALATINGQYLNPNSNPYLRSTFDAAASRMADAYGSGTSAQNLAGFAQNGAFGGSAMLEQQQRNNRAFGDSLANLGNQIYGGNYQNERANQVNMTQNAPVMSNQQLSGSLNANRSIFDAGNSLLDTYGRAINPAYGSQTTGQQNTNQYNNSLLSSNTNTQRQTTGVPRGMSFLAGSLLGSQL